MRRETDIDLLTESALADPFTPLAELRASAPVAWSTLWKGWYVSSHEAVMSGMKDTTRFSSNRISPLAVRNAGPQADISPTESILGAWMTMVDPPDHTRLRSLAQPAFAPRKVRAWETDIERLASGLIETACGRETLDFRDAVSTPLPALVLEAILGIPIEDRERFLDWSEDLKSALFGLGSGSRERAAAAERSLVGFHDYFCDVISQRAKSPRDDVLSDLGRAITEQSFTLHEAAATAVMLVFGGFETTTNLLTNIVHRLLGSDEIRAELARTDDIGPLVEELTRLESPMKAMGRVATTDIELGGQQIRAGDRVLFLLIAANRDPAVFEDPDRFRLDRTSHAHHFAYGQGPHYCLGATLARLEVKHTLLALRPLLDDLTLTDTSPVWEPTLISRAMASLPIAITRSATASMS